MRTQIKQDLVKLLINFIKENEILIEGTVDHATRLIGSNSLFDSIELVTFIVEVEQFIDERYGISVQLASESAMSRRTSPFISIDTLSNYIIELSNE